MRRFIIGREVSTPPQASDRRLRLILFRLAALGFGFILALLLAETAVRIFAPAELWRFQDSTTTWRLDPVLGWDNKQNASITFREPHAGWIASFQTNADGVFPARAQREKPPGVTRILMFGDSAVVGLSVPAESRVNAALEDLLGSRGAAVEVINAGVQGYSTDQELLRMERLVPLYQPDIVTLTICTNDFDVNDARTALGLPKPMFQLGADGGLREIPPDMTGARIEPLVGGPFRFLILHSALYRFFQPALIRLRVKFSDRDQRLLVGLAPEIYYDRKALGALDWKLFAAELREMVRTAAANHAKFICLLHPAVEEVWDPHIARIEREFRVPAGQYDRYAVERRIAELTTSERISFCPLIGYFLSNRARGPFHLLPGDPHCNAAGYRLQAEALAQFLIEGGMVAPRASAVSP